jgi:thymidylate synthase ThyX
MELLPKLLEWLTANYDEKESVLEKKAFDTLRGLLPMATLGQVAFRGNAQAFEYLINRTAKHPLGELRWISGAVKRELDKEIPSLLLRLGDEKSEGYQHYLAERNAAVERLLRGSGREKEFIERGGSKPEVKLVEYDPDAEEKIIAGIIFPLTHMTWGKAVETAKGLSSAERREIMTAYLLNRSARWHKVGRAFENSYIRFEITMNIGNYRDLHRHRMMTQDRQYFSVHHGYDVPLEIKEAGLESKFSEALERAAILFRRMQANVVLAQYAVPLAYRMRFYQWKNFRQLFWETELRTISQGHPDYRFIEQEKYRLVKEKFPLTASFMLVDMNDYAIARRGTEEKIAEKEKAIVEKLAKKRNS